MARSAKFNIHERQRASTKARRGKNGVTSAASQAESAGRLAPSTAPMFKTSIQSIGAVITWLSGSVAGIGAIFYALGYFASKSYVDMLGLNLEDLRYDNISYIRRGGSFLGWLVVDTAPIQLLVLLMILSILFIFVGLRFLCRQLAIRQPFPRPFQHLDWAGIVYVILLFLLAILLIRSNLSYLEGSEVSGLLLSAMHEPATAGSIREAILSGNQSFLRDVFNAYALQLIWIGVLLLLAWWVSQGRRWAVLRVAPFAVMFIIYIFFLAGECGTLLLPITFAEASIPDEHPSTKDYLLNRTQAGYVFWDCLQRRARWVPIEEKRIIFSKEKRTLRQILQSCEEAGS